MMEKGNIDPAKVVRPFWRCVTSHSDSGCGPIGSQIGTAKIKEFLRGLSSNKHANALARALRRKHRH